MGSRHGRQRANNISARPIPSHEVWLQNQTFRIKGQLYTLLDRRGGGAFGSVWAATKPDGHRAAIKVFDLRRLRRDINPLSLIVSFKEEVKMSYQMRDAVHHVATINGFDFDQQRHVALVAMELGDDSLEDRVQRLHMMYPGFPGSGMIGDDYISARDRKNIWVQLANIVMVLHEHNVIHRDIKPANLVFFGPILKIVDLGIAHKTLVGHNAQKLGGTNYFSAPECFTGKAPVTTRADIWSAGAVLYYLTYGQPPIFFTAQPPPGVPPTRSALVQDVLHHCLQKNPNQRASHRWLAQHPLTTSPAIA